MVLEERGHCVARLARDHLSRLNCTLLFAHNVLGPLLHKMHCQIPATHQGNWTIGTLNRYSLRSACKNPNSRTESRLPSVELSKNMSIPVADTMGPTLAVFFCRRELNLYCTGTLDNSQNSDRIAKMGPILKNRGAAVTTTGTMRSQFFLDRQ